MALGSIQTEQIATGAGYLADYDELLAQGVIDPSLVWRARGPSLERTAWDPYLGYYRHRT